MEGMQEF